MYISAFNNPVLIYIVICFILLLVQYLIGRRYLNGYSNIIDLFRFDILLTSFFLESNTRRDFIKNFLYVTFNKTKVEQFKLIWREHKVSLTLYTIISWVTFPLSLIGLVFMFIFLNIIFYFVRDNKK